MSITRLNSRLPHGHSLILNLSCSIFFKLYHPTSNPTTLAPRLKISRRPPFHSPLHTHGLLYYHILREGGRGVGDHNPL